MVSAPPVIVSAPVVILSAAKDLSSFSSLRALPHSAQFWYDRPLAG